MVVGKKAYEMIEMTYLEEGKVFGMMRWSPLVRPRILRLSAALMSS